MKARREPLSGDGRGGAFTASDIAWKQGISVEEAEDALRGMSEEYGLVEVVAVDDGGTQWWRLAGPVHEIESALDDIEGDHLVMVPET